jgi:hypothetical protein
MIGRMRTAAVIAASLLLVTLTGCAPDTSEAYTKCTERGLSYLDETTMTPEAYVDAAVTVAEACQLAAKRDPAAFNAEWS